MGLLDVLQSASNAVAGNVAGPVDLLSFLLRKGGVPVPEDALGGSEWMKRKGLMRDVPKGAEQVVGETLGLLAPTAIAANAPKIARGLLQMGENAAAPRTLNPETGAIVWHGSPYKFDRFDSSKMGTGEGAQAYGAGSYLAEAKKVGEEYKKKLGRVVSAIDNKPTKDVYEEWAVSSLTNFPDPVKAKAYFQNLVDVGLLKGKSPEEMRSYVAAVNNAIDGATGKPVGQTIDGFLYKVDLPDEWLPKMLDWDKKLSQQPAEIQQAVNRLWADNRVYGNPMQLNGEGIYGSLNARFNGGMNRMRAQEAASMDLRHYGIPGIRYLDAASRPSPNIIDQRLLGLLQKHDGNAEAAVDAFMRGVYNTPRQKAAMRADLLKQLSVKPTSNFVIFPGLEDQLKILERNGVPLGLLNP